MKRTILLIISTVLLAVNLSAQTGSTPVVTHLPTEQFKNLLAADKNAILIDLRTPDEVNKGFIKGAMVIDYLSKEFEKEVAKLDKTKTYYIYCQGGGRSGDCSEYMEKQGFKKVYDMEKGFSDWVAKGFPVEKK